MGGRAGMSLSTWNFFSENPMVEHQKYKSYASQSVCKEQNNFNVLSIALIRTALLGRIEVQGV